MEFHLFQLKSIAIKKKRINPMMNENQFLNDVHNTSVKSYWFDIDFGLKKKIW